MVMRLERVYVTTIFVLALLGGVTGAMAQTKPVPLINQPLAPDAVAPGGPAFILTVNGTGFVNKSVVEWNGSMRTTTVVSHSQLTATISARDIATAGTAWVTVVNPAPTSGTSNVAFLSITSPTTTVGFRLGSSLTTGADPSAVAVGDFNGDGNLDLAVVNQNSPKSRVSIFLGDGAGNFAPASSPSTGSGSDSIAVGDFNGDGKLDLAVANSLDNTVSILLGDGKGKFILASSPPVGSAPQSVAVGDFNGDGKLDLAVANFGDATVSILLGDGTGNFTLAPSPASGSRPHSVAVGDFNGDGKLDLAVANDIVTDSTVSILLGDGTGNFTLSSSPATGNESFSVAVGDFNGDDNLDLAVANFGGTVSILLGDGTGHFALASSPATGGEPTSVAVGDFNSDGKLDVVTANANDNTASILLGDGRGNFALASSPVVGVQPSSIVAGDFNGDGKPDLAVPNAGEDTLSILLQGPAVTLSPASFSFGLRKVGTTSPAMDATATNVGYATTTISGISITGMDPDDFSETNNCPSSLTVGASCTIMVKFSPITAGSRTAMVSISGNGGYNPSFISLMGDGTTVVLSPKKLDFGNVMVGKKSQPMDSTLTNIGSTSLIIDSIRLREGDTEDFTVSNTCGTIVPPGGMCTITARFIPTQTGLRAATVVINDNSGGVQNLKLSGTGT